MVELLGLGASVHTCSRNEAELDGCLKDWTGQGFRVTGSMCDVSSRVERERLMDNVCHVFDGKLNILVHSSTFPLFPIVYCIFIHLSYAFVFTHQKYQLGL